MPTKVIVKIDSGCLSLQEVDEKKPKYSFLAQIKLCFVYQS